MSIIYPITDYPIDPPKKTEDVTPWRCDHQWAIRRFVLSNGSVRFCPECQKCHKRNPQRSYGRARAMKEFEFSELEIDALPNVDEKARAQWCWEQSIESVIRAKNRSTEWWVWYDGYLKSPEWYARRFAVLMRDKNRCGACGGDASQVHHLTYERVGREVLDDLVAICDECHDALHARAA